MENINSAGWQHGLSNYPCGNTAGGLVTGLPLQRAIKGKHLFHIIHFSFSRILLQFVSLMLQPGDKSSLQRGCANIMCSCVESRGQGQEQQDTVRNIRNQPLTPLFYFLLGPALFHSRVKLFPGIAEVQKINA